jgi:Cu/Ag efflux protein CusF
MKFLTLTVAQLLAATALATTLPAMAQTAADHSKMDHSKMEHGKMGMAATPAVADGEVRKIDKENGKITIRHGEIKHMDMPPMTMVFTAKDKALLDKVQVGQKIQFTVVHEGGKMVVTDMQPAP